MPGPVSDSLPMPSNRGVLKRWAEGWRQSLAEKGFRYFVLKAEDVFDALTPQQLNQFNKLLQRIEQHRETEGKPGSRSYWVYARHWKGSNSVKALIENLLGHEIGGPY